jgi:Protein of unknown function (DUF1549)/Protein of unknown function (DUF1553)
MESAERLVMTYRFIRLMSLSLLILLVALGTTQAAAPDPYALAERLDTLLEAKQSANGVKPAPLIDDSAFLRRISLDLIGRIPTSYEVYTFIADSAPDKRRRVVDKLLRSPGYVTHQVNLWRALLLPETMTNAEMRFLQPGFDAWLRQKVRDNTPYDRLAYELIAAPIAAANNPQQQALAPNDPRPNPLAFFAAKEGKPENIAAASSRVFLGVQIECAQCHNHPFAKWSREQFWGMAAFFGGIEQRGDNGAFTPVREIVDRRELAIPNTDRVVQATFLDEREPEWKFKTSARVTLAEWMIRPDNPWFARNAGNRAWAQFNGRGIVEPVDDLNDKNPPSHPELLNELAQAFVAAKFDVQFLVRAITATRAYQRSSELTDPGQADGRLFARMAIKGMSGEQLFDSLVVATGYRAAGSRDQSDPNAGSPERSLFLDRFALQGKKTDPQTSILQALSLMNGRFVADASTPGRSETLAAIAGVPLLSPMDRIEALYVATLSRKPTPEELRRMNQYVETGSEGKLKQRLSDVMWVLLNSAEFRLNH